MNLTLKQQTVLNFLKRFSSQFGYMPTTRDIQDEFNFASQTAAVNHLKLLERKGAIQRHPRKARAITILAET